MVLRWIMAGALLAGALGAAALVRRSRAHRTAYRPPVDRLPAHALPEEARNRLVVLGLCSRFCVPCRRTPGVAEEALEGFDDVGFVAVDVGKRPELASLLEVRETPTVLLVDAKGRIRFSHEGNPDPGDLRFFIEEARASGNGGVVGRALQRLGSRFEDE